MKNLIQKNKFKTKKVAIWLMVLFFLFSLFFLANFFYNQNKSILASDEIEIEHEKLKCGREIPVGEAMEKTDELLGELILELDLIYKNAYYQIKAAEEMIDLADQCDIEKCQPIACGSYTVIHRDPITGKTRTVTHCHPQKPCESPWLYHGTYRACPQYQIEDAFKKVSDYYDKIERSKKEIWVLINGTDNGVDKWEFLCDKLNEDIRTTIEKAACAIPPCSIAPKTRTCPKITIIEAIKRKLNRARGEFDKCHISPEDWGKIERGEKTGKYLFSCPIVAKEDYPRYTKTEETIEGKKIPVCTSPHNWFCCSDMP